MEVIDVQLYEYAPNIQTLLQEERFQRSLHEGINTDELDNGQKLSFMIANANKSVAASGNI